MNGNRRTFLLSAAAAALAPTIGVRAETKTYPNQPITVIVPFSPGGNIDVTTRVLTQAMGKQMGATFIIQNRPGAGGLVGFEATARAKPDGYTLFTSGNGTYSITPKIAPGKTVKSADLTGIGMMTITPLVLVVPASGKFKTIADFVAYARANPGKISIGHAGVGTTNHIAILQLQEALGTTFNIVPYKGSSPGLADLVGAQIDAFMDQVATSLPLVASGKLRALAMIGKSQAPELAKVPTTVALGYPNVDMVTAGCMLAPANTPPAIIEALNKALNDALASAEVKERLVALGAETQPMSVQAFNAFLRKEDENAARLIQKGLLQQET
jgi:tripartite-type tricarboxylate transporter receptor subunit TctC